ncbi:MAG: Wzz/FepE/Etk N-terminal domain-containing protein, partial [Pirellulaceae bacterium]|nr:Wzz/FepE/Etk N-terminal domain-containing protein [Pirellulaceae bacterium]
MSQTSDHSHQNPYSLVARSDDSNDYLEPQTTGTNNQMAVGEVFSIPVMAGIFRRRFLLLIFLAALLGGGAGALTWFLIPVQYQATALLHIKRQEVDQYGEAIRSGNSSKDLEIIKATQIALLQSPYVLEKALENKAIADTPYEQMTVKAALEDMEKRITLQSQGENELIEVIFAHEDEEVAQSVANAIVEAYEELVINRNRLERTDHQVRLRTRYDDLEKRIETETQTVLDLKKAKKTLDLDTARSQYQLAIDRVRTLSNQRDKLILDMGQTQVAIEVEKVKLGNRQVAGIPKMLIEQELQKDFQYSKLQEEVSFAEQAYNQYRG